MNRLTFLIFVLLAGVSTAQAQDGGAQETPAQFAQRTGRDIANSEFATPADAQEVQSQGALEYMTRRCNEAFRTNAVLRQPCIDAATDQDMKNFMAAQQAAKGASSPAPQAPPVTPVYSIIDVIAAGNSIIGRHIQVNGRGSCVLSANICIISTEAALESSTAGDYQYLAFSVQNVADGSDLRKAVVKCSDMTHDICNMQVVGSIVSKQDKTFIMSPESLYIMAPANVE
ncbi:hypothetical protein S101446_00716 [Komagataeibacter europaeus]|nr:hypothetical protein S101446_00716 [Komagataeibacter europaeus]